MARPTPDSDTANEPRYSKQTSRQDIGAALDRAAADTDSLDTVDVELVFIVEAWINEVARETDDGRYSFIVPLSALSIDEGWAIDGGWSGHYIADSLRYHDNAPAAVAEWPGPFELIVHQVNADPPGDDQQPPGDGHGGNGDSNSSPNESTADASRESAETDSSVDSGDSGGTDGWYVVVSGMRNTLREYPNARGLYTDYTGKDWTTTVVDGAGGVHNIHSGRVVYAAPASVGEEAIPSVEALKERHAPVAGGESQRWGWVG